MMYEKGIAIFIDLLGQQRVTDFRMKKEIHDLFHAELVEVQDRQNFVKESNFDRWVRSFSDCAYIIYKFKEPNNKTDEDYLTLLYIALSNLNLTTNKFLETGIFLRGGVAVGDLYYDDFGAFGDAINRAYRLESSENFCNYPMIQIEQEFGRKLIEFETNNLGVEPFYENRGRLALEIDKFIVLNFMYSISKAMTTINDNFYDNQSFFQHLIENINKNRLNNICEEKCNFCEKCKITHKMNNLERILEITPNVKPRMI